MTLPIDPQARDIAREKRNAADRARYLADPEYAQKKRDRAKATGRKNTEANRARAKAWREANPERVFANQVRWYNANKGAQRKSALKRNYGLTPEQLDAMRLAQKDLCAICRKPPTGRWSTLCVDHCHDTGRVRGLLCNNCNRAIGLLGDNETVIQAAAGYIRFHDMEVANASH